MTTIYAVLRPDVEVCLSNIRYVGLTGKELDERLTEHILESKNPKRNKSHRTKWFKSMVDEGVRPVIYPLEAVDADDAPLCEQLWIARLRQLGCSLVNGTEGGETSRQTAESRAKMSANRSGKPGRVWTEDELRRMSVNVSASIKLKYDTDPEYRARQLAGCRQRAPISSETRQKMIDARQPGPNKGNHTRWHTNRGLVQDDCPWCAE